MEAGNYPVISRFINKIEGARGAYNTEPVASRPTKFGQFRSGGPGESHNK